MTSLAVEFARPSRLRVTTPLGGRVPAGGIPTVMVTVTVMTVPAAGAAIEGTTVMAVVLFWLLIVTGCDVDAA